MARKKARNISQDANSAKPLVTEDRESAAHWVQFFSRLNLRTVEFFREWLAISSDTWSSAKMMLENGTAFRAFKRPKASGGWRVITAPAGSLKEIQRRLLDLVFTRLFVHFGSYAGIQRRSTKMAVEQHATGTRAFYLIDIKDAYPSVKAEMIKAAIRPQLLPHLAAIAPHLSDEERELLVDLVAQISCWRGRLAQGSPASVALMNVVRFRMDCEIRAYLRTQGDFTYTVFVDDITISRSDQPEISKQIREAVKKIMEKYGFEPNRNKRARKEDYLPANASRVPVILGLVPHGDGRTTIAPEDIKRFRAILYQALAKSELDERERAQVAGVIGYVHMIYGDEPPSDLRRLYDQYVERFGAPGAVAVTSGGPSKADPPHALDASASKAGSKEMKEVASLEAAS